MKKRITREEVSKQLVSDSFFEKGHVGLKLRQSFLTLVAWVAVIVPFVWIAFPVFYPQTAAQIRFRTYIEEATVFKLLALFLAVSFLFLLILFVFLTLRNNRHFHRTLQKEVLHDERKLEQRKEILEAFFDARFGPEEMRHSVCYYEVKPEQNLSETEIAQLYKDKGVSL
jgi:hypothetical protein